jgi:hypothetical protein
VNLNILFLNFIKMQNNNKYIFSYSVTLLLVIFARLSSRMDRSYSLKGLEQLYDPVTKYIFVLTVDKT